MARRLERTDTERSVSFESVIQDVMPLVDTQLHLEVQLGTARMSIRDLLELEIGSLLELKKSAGEPMDVLTKNRTVMRGEVTVLEDNLGLRITEIVDPSRRV